MRTLKEFKKSEVIEMYVNSLQAKKKQMEKFDNIPDLTLHCICSVFSMYCRTIITARTKFAKLRSLTHISDGLLIRFLFWYWQFTGSKMIFYCVLCSALRPSYSPGGSSLPYYIHVSLCCAPHRPGFIFASSVWPQTEHIFCTEVLLSLL